MKTVGSLLKRHTIKPKKSFGQNFLVDINLLKKLLSELQITKKDVVLEIGSGLGLLSAMAAEQAKQVIAVEKDLSLIQIARSEFKEHTNLEFIESDFLEVDLEKLLGHFKRRVLVLGNVPYNISTPIIFKLLENKNLFSEAVLTLQKEVVGRLVAGPGGKDYGVLSIMSQAQSRLKKLFDLSPACFIPPPEVTSSAIKIDFQTTLPWETKDVDLLRKIVSLAFQKRRKTIKNALPEEYHLHLEKTGISLQARPEMVSVSQFVALSNTSIDAPQGR